MQILQARALGARYLASVIKVLDSVEDFLYPQLDDIEELLAQTRPMP